MSTSTLKRSRTEAQAPSRPLARPIPRAELDTLLTSLLRKDLQSILLDAAERDPTLSALISAHADVRRLEKRAKVDAKRDAESQRVISFDHYSKSACHELNTAHKSKRCSRQFEAAGEVGISIQNMFDTIASQVQRHSSYGTKLSALETMRKMCKSIILSEGELPRTVRQDIWGEEMRAMLKVAALVTRAEAAQFEEEGLIGRLEELRSLSRDEYIFKELKEVLETITGYQYKA